MAKPAAQYLNYLITSRSAHGVHSPFVYRFIHELIENNNVEYYQFEKLNAIRNGLLKNNAVIEIKDFGAGSKVFKDDRRRISDIAKHGISKRKYSELYFKLANFCNANYILELGTSIGLNTLYFAKSNSKTRVYTIEGCPEIAAFAQKLFDSEQAGNIKLINATFEEALQRTLNEIPQLDILYIDGNHQYAPTLNYFEQALKKKHDNSVFIFDDINWNENMQRAWSEIKLHPEVTLSIDLYFTGLIFFRKEQKEKEHFVLKY